MEMRDEPRDKTLKAKPQPLDKQAWLEELAFIEERARQLPDGGSTKQWRREDSYEDEVRS